MVIKKMISGKEAYVRTDSEGIETVIGIGDLTDDEKESLGITSQVPLAEVEQLKKEKLALKKQLKDLTNASKNQDDPEKDAMAAELAELRKLKTDLEQRDEEMSLKDKNEFQKKEYQLNKQIKELQQKNDQLQASLNEMQSSLSKKDQDYMQKTKEIRVSGLQTRLQTIANENKAYNPLQVADLLINRFVWDETSNDFVVQVKDNKGRVVDEKSPEEFVKEFLAKKENDNLVRVNMLTGSGDQHSQDNSNMLNNNQNQNNNQQQQNKTSIKMDAKLIKEAQMNDMKPEAWLEVLEEKKRIFDSKRNKK